MSDAWPPPSPQGEDPIVPPGYGWPAQPQPPPPPYGYGYPPQPQQWPPAYPPPYPVYAASPPVNGLAIAAMVLGILWLYWVGSILAVVFGHIALHQIRQRGQGGSGMAIAGLVLGYIGIAVLALVVVFGVFVATSVHGPPASPQPT